MNIMTDNAKEYIPRENWRWNTIAERDEEEVLRNDLREVSHLEMHSKLRGLFFEEC
jgi:hypothetical protein